MHLSKNLRFLVLVPVAVAELILIDFDFQNSILIDYDFQNSILVDFEFQNYFVVADWLKLGQVRLINHNLNSRKLAVEIAVEAADADYWISAADVVRLTKSSLEVLEAAEAVGHQIHTVYACDYYH